MSDPLSVKELENAKKIILNQVQMEEFVKEIEDLKLGRELHK